jgi:hypothetical protein
MKNLIHTILIEEINRNNNVYVTEDWKGIKKGIVGAALGAGLAMGSPAKGQTNTNKPSTEMSTETSKFSWVDIGSVSENTPNNFTEDILKSLIGKDFYVLNSTNFRKENAAGNYVPDERPLKGEIMKLVTIGKQENFKFIGYYLEFKKGKQSLFYEYSRSITNRGKERTPENFSGLAIINDDHSKVSVSYGTSQEQSGKFKSPDAKTSTGPQWSKVDSVKKSKDQIYSDTKMFIAEGWKSAKDVIQNDDKDKGVILIRTSINKKIILGGGLTEASLWYTYNVKFLMKDGKYKIIVDNFNYDHGTGGASTGMNIANTIANGPQKKQEVEWIYKTNPLEPFPGLMRAGMSEKKYLELRESIQTDMQSIVDSYDKYIKTTTSDDGDW